ncbi:MAG TPA: biotin--[acetyl-CoA-carboxylase] ligase, partial [Sphingomicrobium sp.]|nr:biotin--[acetyl-CoA-carboxylase] ligase [Sphingomicrobium sp.]
MTRIRIVERTGSTNADLIADPGAAEGDWLVALAQQAGRGRQGRTWTPAPGNFYASTLVELRPTDPPAQILSLAAGLALIEAIDAAVPTQPLMLKWPNDLMLLGKKLAGILLERSGDRVAVGFGVNLATAPPLSDRQGASLGGQVVPQAFAPLLAGILLERSGDRVAVGFGVNLASAPQLPDRQGASLSGQLVPQAFAPLLAGSFARLVDLWRRSEPALLAHAWLARAHPIGTRLTVHASADER